MEGRFDVVVIVASFGGVEALRTVVGALPPTFPLPVVIVQHRSTAAPNVLAKVIGFRSRLPVRDAIDGEAPEAGTVYVGPPGMHLWFDALGCMHSTDGRRINYTATSGDPLFVSAARAFGGRVIAVVLTGTGKNGAAGVRAVKNAGGTVIAQDETTSVRFGMPKAAIGTGAVDAVLPLEDIAPALVQLAAIAS